MTSGSGVPSCVCPRLCQALYDPEHHPGDHGGFGSWGWRSLFTEHPCVLYTAFGSSYVAYELPHAPNLIAAYGDESVVQPRVVRFDGG